MADESDLTGATPRRRPKQGALEIGGRKLKPSTLMMGHGYDPALSEGSLKPPIFLTSTFVFENAAAGKRHFEGVTGKRPGGAEGLVYSRFNGPNQEILEDRLGHLGGCRGRARASPPACRRSPRCCSPSSSRATSSSIRAALRRDRDPDRPHPRPLRRDLARFPGRRDRGRDRRDVVAQAKAKGRVPLIYLESPANPTNALVDVEAVARVRDALFAEGERPPIAIDNTFLGPLWQQPLRHGADLVGLLADQICRRP